MVIAVAVIRSVRPAPSMSGIIMVLYNRELKLHYIYISFNYD